MDIPPAHIQEVLDFYTMFNKQPVGRHHIFKYAATSAVRWRSGRELIEHLCHKLRVKEGEISKDGRFTISRAECLGLLRYGASFTA